MAYTPFTWVDDDGSFTKGTPFSATRMNAIEQGIAATQTPAITQDWNTALAGGWYRDNPAGTTVNSPIATQTGYVGEVMATGAASGFALVQVLYETGRQRSWMRRGNTAGTVWSPWTTISGAELVTGATGVTTAVDGDERIFVVDASLGVYWRFRYFQSDTSGYPWYFIGGSVVGAAYSGAETIATTGAWLDPTNATSVLLALAGDYLIDSRAYITVPATAGAYGAVSVATVTPSNVTTNLDFTFAAQLTSPGGAMGASVASVPQAQRIATAGTTVKQRVYASSTGCTTARRQFTIIPIRVKL